MRPHFHSRRGQAMTEFALLAPILIVILLYSMYFAALMHAKLKLQEASRFAAWELTSYALDDYGSANHASAFNAAKTEQITNTVQKFADLDSLDDRSPGDFVVGYSNAKVTMTNLDAPVFANPIPSPGGNSFINSALGMLNGAASATYGYFKFNTKGRVQVEMKIQIDNRILPHHFLDENSTGFFKADVWGGRNLQNLTVKNRFTLLASGWALPDGADAMQHTTGPGGPRSGVHRGGSDSGLYAQVSRMRLMGAPNLLGSIPGFDQVMNIIGNFVPNPITATYVMSNNYFEAGNSSIDDHGCDQDPSHGAVWGMNNLNKENANDGPGLDNVDENGGARRKCYDTAPFRDTSKYANSLYRQIYQARGGYFMGCKKAQADNPAEAGPPSYIGKDKHNKKINCEGP